MKEKFMRALSLEDALDALRNGYYDTHDLDGIEENREAYEAELDELKRYFQMEPNEYFCNYTWHEFNGPMRKNHR